MNTNTDSMILIPPYLNLARDWTEEVVEQISEMKGEPQWMLDFRLKALDHFLKRPMPTWGGDLSQAEPG